MVLSILICSVNKRVEECLPKIFNSLRFQASVYDNVEVLALCDNKKRSVGQKRNDLINVANGQYVCFVDDDDEVEMDYVDKIMEAINGNKDIDCVCFGAARYVDKVFDKAVKYGVQYRKDSEDGQLYYRIPNHLMVIKRAIALSTPFDYISFGEDAAWAKKILYKIQTQATIDKVLYHYYFSPTNTETQNGNK